MPEKLAVTWLINYGKINLMAAGAVMLRLFFFILFSIVDIL
ncbi:MAG TPA: hypothetical protein VIK14_05235 [Ignavibacteria bacterium]